MSGTESHEDPTLVDPLRGAAPGTDLEARRAKASVGEALFGGGAPDDADRVTIGRYEVRERLGAGGMGAVYRAHDPELDRLVALKVLLPDVADDDDARARMIREARALAKLSHPNVIPVYDVGRDGAEVFLAMELVEGQDLSRWLKAEETRAWQTVMDVFLQAARGLAAAHERGLVHRDFKPANVLLGDDGRARVVDFGLARAVDPAAMPLIDEAPTRTGAILGTPMYMAPEQLEGRPANAASDQFAFCVSLYGALYGERPFRGETVASYVSHVIAGDVVEPQGEDVPRAVYRALRRGLRTKPDERWPSIDALVLALEDASTDAGGPSRRSGPRPPWALLGAAAAVLGGAAWWGLSRSPATGDADRVAGARTLMAADARPRPSKESDETGAGAAAVAGTGPTSPVADDPLAPSVETSASAEASDTVAATSSGTEEESTGSAIETDTGAEVPEATSPKPRRARDWCSFHEDTYALVERSNKRRRSFADGGKCWTCRTETNKRRIARLSPRDCGGYQMCTPGPLEDCS